MAAGEKSTLSPTLVNYFKRNMDNNYSFNDF